MPESVASCDLCRADLREAEHVYDFNGFPLVRCACGLVLTNPRPTPEEIGDYYAAGYYAYVASDTPTAKERLKNAVLGELGGYPPSSHVPRWLVKAAAVVLRPHIMVVPPYVPDGRLLDAGCGAGIFLRWCRQAGWRASGLEVDERAVASAVAAGLDVTRGTMEDCPLPSDTFDVVVLNHVLEHCHDPNRVLQHCRRVLKSGGRLIVGVPNFACYDNEVFQDAWSNCEAPRHLYHFTPETLRAFLERYGFAVEELRFKKWLIPYSERISFRFLRRNLAAEPFWTRTRRTLSARARVQLLKKLALGLHLWPDRKLGQMMTAYSRLDTSTEDR